MLREVFLVLLVYVAGVTLVIRVSGDLSHQLDKGKAGNQNNQFCSRNNNAFVFLGLNLDQDQSTRTAHPDLTEILISLLLEMKGEIKALKEQIGSRKPRIQAHVGQQQSAVVVPTVNMVLDYYPTQCSEVSAIIGYVYPGFYMVRDYHNSSNAHYVYCQ